MTRLRASFRAAWSHGPVRPAGLLVVLLAAAAGARPAVAEEARDLRFPETPVASRQVGGKAKTQKTHDFGTVAQHAELTASIPYRNAGKAPLEGLRVKSGCSCFGATLSHTALAPGAAGTLTVRFRSGTIKGAVNKALRLLYRTASGQTMTELRIAANVTAGILVERAWFGQVRAGSKPTASAPISWFEGVGTPFKITKIEVPGPKVATRIEPYAVREPLLNEDGTPVFKDQMPVLKDGKPVFKDGAPVLRGREPLLKDGRPVLKNGKPIFKPREPVLVTTYRGWTVHYTFLEAPPKGVYSRRATLHTTHPKHPTVTVPLSATVVGALWVQTSRVYLGLIPAGRERSASVAIKGSGKDPPPLTGVEAKTRKGVLRVSVTDGFDPFKGPHKVITVHVPAGVEPGPLDDVLEIRASGIGGEVTEIQIVGRIYKPQGPAPKRAKRGQ